MACPTPFIAESEWKYSGGSLPGRACSKLTPELSCCLPCPLIDWVYSDSFTRNLQIAYWFNIPSLICEVFLLLTFLFLPQDVGHGHYLSIGLVFMLAAMQLSFLVPLGVQPSQCHDPITPDDMYSDTSCAWSGALLLWGAMGTSVWIMLRSLWTHLRVCWNFKQHGERLLADPFFWTTLGLGIGLPGLFMTVEMPITGVSYRIGPTCVANEHFAFTTWFGWLIGFSGLGAIFQFATTSYCLWLYLRDIAFTKQPKTIDATGTTTSSRSRGGNSMTRKFAGSIGSRKLVWKRVSKVLKSQWRSMVLCTTITAILIYYGTVFVQQTNGSSLSKASGMKKDGLLDWATCLVLNQGRKNKCVTAAAVLGLSEVSVVASFYIVSLFGPLVGCLMVRGSMFSGWADFFRDPMRGLRVKFRNPSIGDEDFMVVPTKRKSFGHELESDKERKREAHHLSDIATGSAPPMPGLASISPVSPVMREETGLLPDAVVSRQQSVDEITHIAPSLPKGSNDSNVLTTMGTVPEAGDVAVRHESPKVNWFEDEDEDTLPKRRSRRHEDMGV